MRGYSRNGRDLQYLFETIGLDSERICICMIKGISSCIDTLDSANVYDLTYIIAKNLPPSIAAEVCERFANRVISRVPEKDREFVEVDGCPKVHGGGYRATNLRIFR